MGTSGAVVEASPSGQRHLPQLPEKIEATTAPMPLTPPSQTSCRAMSTVLICPTGHDCDPVTGAEGDADVQAADGVMVWVTMESVCDSCDSVIFSVAVPSSLVTVGVTA